MAKRTDIPDDVQEMMSEGTVFNVRSYGSSQLVLIYHSGPRPTFQVGEQVTVRKA